MGSFQNTLAGALRQLSGMNVSQRVAIALGVAMVIGSLVWMANWAATPEMVPLLSGQSLSDTEIADIRSGLQAMNETHKVDGSKVLVRADANRAAILAQLGMMNKMPADTSIGFAEMVKEANPWLPQEENNKRWTVALTTELSRILGQLNGVKSAKVFLNLNPRDRGFSRNQPESKASVVLTMKSGEPVGRSLATAAAKVVSGAVRGLPVQNVEVVDAAGRTALNWEDEGVDSAPGLTRLQKQLEQETAAKIADQLSFDRNLRVSVQVVLDRSAMVKNEATPIDGVEVEKIKTEQTTSRNRNGGQPGVEVNTGAVAASGGTGGDVNTSTSEEIRSQPGMTHTTTTNPAGTVRESFAAINVSYSYLAGIYKRRNPDKEPGEVDIQSIFNEQKTRIENQAAKLVQPPNAKQVAVDWYYDSVEAEAGSAGTASASAGVDMPYDLAARYGPIGALGLLALAAMFFMFRMARQKDAGEVFGLELGLPKEAIEAARKAADDIDAVAGTIERSSGRAAGGRAARGTGGAARSDGAYMGEDDGSIASVIPVPMGLAAEGVLEAQEVDERTVQINRMVEQVGAMAKEDEEGIGTLVEKWIDQTDRSL